MIMRSTTLGFEVTKEKSINFHFIMAPFNEQDPKTKQYIDTCVYMYVYVYIYICIHVCVCVRIYAHTDPS